MSDEESWLEEEDDEFSDDEYTDDDQSDDDSTDMVTCPQCGAEIYADAVRCPVCENYVTHGSHALSDRPLWWILLGLAGIVAVLLRSPGSSFGDQPALPWLSIPIQAGGSYAKAENDATSVGPLRSSFLLGLGSQWAVRAGCVIHPAQVPGLSGWRRQLLMQRFSRIDNWGNGVVWAVVIAFPLPIQIAISESGRSA